MRRLLLIAFFLEMGFALMVVPWSDFWDANYFARAVPGVAVVITNDYVRGAVSGIGLVNLVAGMAELFSLLMAGGQEPPTQIPSLRDD